MEQLVQAVELTIIGMVVVFVVLSLLTIILNFMGKVFAPEEEKKVKSKTVKNNGKNQYSTKTSSSDAKRAAAVTAALAMYEQEKDNS